MDKKRIVLRMEGPDENGNHLAMSVFAKNIQHFADMLKESAKQSGEEGVEFRIVNLFHSSPMVMECEPITKDNQFSSRTFEVFNDYLRRIKEGNPDAVPELFRNSAEKIAKSDPKKLLRAEITVQEGADEHTYDLDKDSIAAPAPQFGREVFIGRVDGKLEVINIHNDTNTFRIYRGIPIAPPVTCKFPKEMLGDVQDALGSYVSVYGECRYKPDSNFPHEIKIREMEKLPDPKTLPSLMDLRGIAPNATGGKSSEQFVREMRDEWD